MMRHLLMYANDNGEPRSCIVNGPYDYGENQLALEGLITVLPDCNPDSTIFFMEIAQDGAPLLFDRESQPVTPDEINVR